MQATEWDDKEKYENEFESKFLEILQHKVSFKYKFSKLPINLVCSSDEKLRLITWSTGLGGSWIDWAGIVQWIDKSDKVHAKLLDDVSSLLESNPDTT